MRSLLNFKMTFVCLLAVLSPVALVSDADATTVTPVSQSKSLRYFISGHSLVDNPFGDQIEKIARSLGFTVGWNQQIVIGSPISYRTKGPSAAAVGWAGYGVGKDARGRQGGNVLDDFAARAAEPYHNLIIAEGHHTVAALHWNDTPRYLRHFHDRFMDHNVRGRTFFFEPWESIKSTSDLASWSGLEKSASGVWGCMVGRINLSLAHEGRSDRITSVPSGLALATLMEDIVAGKLPAFAARTTEDVAKLFLSDDVHLTPRGTYLMALLYFHAMTDVSPAGAWAPPSLTPDQARDIQAFVSRFAEAEIANRRTLDLPACRALMVDRFCDQWNAYVPGRWVSRQDSCKTFFSRDTAALGRFDVRNPFVFEPAAEVGYWFARD